MPFIHCYFHAMYAFNPSTEQWQSSWCTSILYLNACVPSSDSECRTYHSLIKYSPFINFQDYLCKVGLIFVDRFYFLNWEWMPTKCHVTHINIESNSRICILISNVRHAQCEWSLCQFNETENICQIRNKVYWSEQN